MPSTWMPRAATSVATRTAQKVGYSDRTVKTIIHDLQTRLQMKNRTQMVAFAYQHGYL
ncbi:response regulator transcription factor [Streptomyces venezuelae]|uniref:response regulator transcription factor n=1 Tax=Streptomyces venezuelae TaxID=54571 RepID=UPI000D8C5B8D|nr:response regulator transcription factor [Streptomyces venezuelae]